jgi:hypothetical protein
MQPYDQQPPTPAAGAEPDSYRRKLMRTVRDHLSVNDERRIDSAGVTAGQMARLDGTGG